MAGSGFNCAVTSAAGASNPMAATGRFNLAQGFVGTLAGIGASLSTAFFGLVVGNFGNVIGFLGIAAAALGTVFLAWSLMPETKPPNEKSELLGST
jgi:sugar phosphate permease